MNKIFQLILLVSVFILSGCSSSRKSTVSLPVRHIAMQAPKQDTRLQYFFLEALNQREKGNYADAFALYQHCLDINPHAAFVLAELSNFYFFLGQEEKGIEALKKAAQEDTSNYWYKMQLGDYYQQKGDWLKAVSVYQDMAELFPKRLEPVMELESIYEQNKQYEKAIEALNRLEELDGRSEAITLKKVTLYQQLGKHQEAYDELSSLIREYPYDLRYQTALGDAYLQNKQTEKAYEIYQKILKDDPDYAPALVSMAQYYKATQQDSLYTKQIDHLLFNKDVESDVKQTILLNQIMQSENGDKDSLRMAAVIQRVLSTPQQNANLAMMCAQYFISKNMKAQAIPVLSQIIQLDPSNKPARLQLISYAWSERDYDKIIQIAQPALQYASDGLEMYYYLGMAYFMKDQKELALETFQKGVNNISESTDKQIVADFYSIMGDILHDKGKKQEAYQAYESALKYAPNNVSTLNNYAYFLSQEKNQLDKAEEMSYLTVKAEPQNPTYLDTYAWILFQKGNFTQARIYIEQALNTEEGKGSIYYEHAGDIYFKLGEKEKAFNYWKKAIEAEKNRIPDATPRPESEMKLLKQKINLKRYIEP